MSEVIQGREYYRKHRQEVLSRKRLYYQQHRDKILEKRKKYRERKPLIHKARDLAKWNIPLGIKCEVCESTQHLERHHPNYSKPFCIVTVCHSCHMRIHSNKRARSPLVAEKTRTQSSLAASQR